jgi:phenylpropionate dioxygenase-like ring-hydroxylating dioxygenase large terminal subunit
MNDAVAENHQPFGGYHLRDVPPEDAELTHAGPGTPCGEYLRRTWQPVCLSEELTDLPLALRIMNEDLVAFRDRSGRVGVLHRHCSHRGTSLEYGIVSERGIRCCYHGWLFDVDGTILETPGEPPDSRLRDSLFHGAYPALEYRGLVFAYLGPPDQKPEFPDYDSYGTPEDRMKAFSIWFPCNWVQAADNFMDPEHTTFLHVEMTGNQFGSDAWSVQPDVEYLETPSGDGMIYMAKRRMSEQLVYFRCQHLMMPNYWEGGSTYEEAKEQKYFQRSTWNRWMVPVDDTHSWSFGWRYLRDGIDPGRDNEALIGRDTIDIPGHPTGGGRTYEEQQREPGDWDAQTSQRRIAVHAREHLGSTDRGVGLWRQLLRRGVRGESPLIGPRLKTEQGRPFVSAYTNDTVFQIARRPDAEERELLRDLGRRIAAVLFESDDAELSDRQALMTQKLKEIEASVQ